VRAVSQQIIQSGKRALHTGWAPVLRRYGVILALGLLLIAMAIGSPSFLALPNLLNILNQWSPVGIMAVGSTYVILAGGFDLSLASGFGLCAVITALLANQGWSPEIDFLSSLLVGTVIGVLNAFLVVGLKVNPFIATLGSGFVLAGIPFIITKNPFINVDMAGFDWLGTGSWLGVPYAGMVLVGFMIAAGIALSKTAYGQWIYAVGGNPETSRLFGIPVGLITASTYIFSGFCVGAAAAIATSQLNYSSDEQDPALLFNVIVAVVVGGNSLSGGFGAIWRTAVGLGILATLQNGLNLLQVNSFSQDVVKGLIIVGAVGLDGWMRQLASSAERRARRVRYSIPPKEGSSGARPALEESAYLSNDGSASGGLVP
jgi:ribose transport system permease protein